MKKTFLPTALLFFLLGALTSCASGPETSPVDGTWDFTMSSPFGVVNATVVMVTEGDVLSGSFDLGNGRVWAIEDGVANGSEISFSLDRDGSPMVYDMSAVIDGDAATGTARAMGTEASWSMTRRS